VTAEGVRRHDRGDLTQRLTAQTARACRQLASIVISQPKTLVSQLPAQAAVLRHQLADHLSLLTLQPTSHDGEQQL